MEELIFNRTAKGTFELFLKNISVFLTLAFYKDLFVAYMREKWDLSCHGKLKWK